MVRSVRFAPACSIAVVLCAVSIPSSGGAPESAAPRSPSGCGREPQAPVVDSSSVDRYDASIDRVAAYDNAARAYSACVTRIAIAEQTQISNDAKARMNAIRAAAASVQQRIAGNFSILSAQLDAARRKLVAGRKSTGHR